MQGEPLKAGTYSLFTIPENHDNWTIIFNKNPNQWGTFDYKESEDALRVPVQAAGEIRVVVFVDEDREVHVVAVLQLVRVVLPGREHAVLGPSIVTDETTQITEPDPADGGPNSQSGQSPSGFTR